MIARLSYRHNYVHHEECIRDTFDGLHYRKLLRKNVTIDGVERPYKYFSDKRDIALGLCIDGYLLYKQRRNGPSATPILLQIFNFPPRIRTHLENLLCVGIIPKRPKMMSTFLTPVEDELATLANGVRTFDAVERAIFDLHAYLIQEQGDIVAIEKLLGIKGHNAYCPCRNCKMKGVRDITRRGKIYYIPVTTPDDEHLTRPSVDPRNLRKRTHAEFNNVLQRMSATRTKGERNVIGKHYGIREAAILSCVGSIDLARSIPWDWMHLLCENVIPKLVDLWTGRHKSLNARTEDYELMPHIWEEIGEETATAVKTIPAAFVRVLGNIAEDRSQFTAESWGFWFMYVAPIVLQGRFQKKCYYKHMCLLVDIMKMTLKFEITYREIDRLEEAIVRWVEQYER